MKIEIKLPSDSDSFVALECPFCNERFKLYFSEYYDEEYPVEELFCPYCGLTRTKDCFFTKETVDAATKAAINYVIENVNSAAGKMAKDINKLKYVHTSFKPLKEETARELKEHDTTEEAFRCNSCGRTEKVVYCAGASKVFCAYCGVDL